MGNHDELLRKREAREAEIDPYAPPPAAPDDVELALAAVRQQAMQVGDDFEDFKEAIMIERESAAAIMEAALAALRPALGALIGRIETRRASEAVRDREGKLQVQQRGKVQYYQKRGALVVNRFEMILGEGVREERDEAGAYGGMGLYVLESGNWAIGQRTGTWSRRIGEHSLFELELKAASSAEVLEVFRVEAVLGGMIEALGKQDGLAAATERTRRRIGLLKDGLGALLQGLRA